MQTMTFDSDDIIVAAVWARAERMYQTHGRSLGYDRSWKAIGLTARFRFFELSASALKVST